MENNNEQLIIWLLQGFVDNCGVSAGMRTFYWDLAWHVLDDKIPENKLSLNDYFKMKMPHEYEETKNYDISCLEKEQIQRIGLEILDGDEIPVNLKSAFDENFNSYLLTLD